MNNVQHEILICGGTILYRSKCPDCGEYNLSGSLKFICGACYSEYELKIVASKIRKVASPNDYRHVSNTDKRKTLKEQKHKCFWCGRKFGTWYNRKGLSNQLNIVFDHVIPFKYSRTSNIDNMVASCNLCNSWKSDMVFPTHDECREFLKRRWQKEFDKHKIIVAGENGDFSISKDNYL